jgi:hypothetical protein
MPRPIGRRSTTPGAHLAAALVFVASLGSAAEGPKFYPDDPISSIVDSEDASAVQERKINLIYDTAENSSTGPATRRRTSARRISTPWTRCRTRAGSRTGWAVVL